MNASPTIYDEDVRLQTTTTATPVECECVNWRKSDAYLRMLNSKYAAHIGGGTLTQFVKDVAAEVSDARLE